MEVVGTELLGIHSDGRRQQETCLDSQGSDATSNRAFLFCAAKAREAGKESIVIKTSNLETFSQRVGFLIHRKEEKQIMWNRRLGTMRRYLYSCLTRPGQVTQLVSGTAGQQYLGPNDSILCIYNHTTLVHNAFNVPKFHILNAGTHQQPPPSSLSPYSPNSHPSHS